MDNLEKYNKAFMDNFNVVESELKGLDYHGIEIWDSVGHMALIAALEEAFDIMFAPEDVVDFSSYEKGKEILAKPEYGINFG